MRLVFLEEQIQATRIKFVDERNDHVEFLACMASLHVDDNVRSGA